MPVKVMVVSYNSIHGVPHGRYEKGNAVAYSAEWDFERFAELSMRAMRSAGRPSLASEECDAIENAATTALESLEAKMAHDLPSIETVFIYTGVSAMTAAMTFIKRLQELGKTVHMVACKCDRKTKAKFAEQAGIAIIWSHCGGEDKCGEIFAQHVI